MKKIIIVTNIIALFCMVTFNSFADSPTSCVKPKIKINFKHSGCQGCQCNSTSCTCPLGICIIIQFSMSPLTADEYAKGYGTATGTIENGQLHLIFDRDAALADGTIPIDQDFFIGSEVSQELGYHTVTISRGTYRVDFSTYTQFGEAWFNAVLQ